MTTINSSAAAARESARSTDGKFGHQAHAEADISLTDRQEPYFGSIAVTAAITEMDGFAHATAHRDGTITATTVHGYTLGLMQDGRGTWWSQPVVNDTGIDWGNRYGRDRYRGSTPQQALRLTAHDVHLQAEVTGRLHRELGAAQLAGHTTPDIYSAITLETEHDGSRTTIVTMDDPVNPGTSTEIIAMLMRTPDGHPVRAVSKIGQMLAASRCEEKIGAGHQQIFDALHGAATSVDASVYGDGTSAGARYHAAADRLEDEAEEAGYTTVIAQRPDQPHRGTPNQPVVRFSTETHYYSGSVEIAGDTGKLQRRFMGQPVDEFPAIDRRGRKVFYADVEKFRGMEKFALERAEQIAEINRLSATGLTDAPKRTELYS